MTIKFETTANQRFEGVVREDLGHAYLVEVTKGPKPHRGRTALYSKAHMIHCTVTREA